MSNDKNKTDKNIFNTLLIYGATGTGKTREIGAVALDIWKRYGKRTRLISADGGGWGSIQDYVDAGLIAPLNISDAETPLTQLRRLARGDWPHDGGWLMRDKDPRWKQVGMYAIEGFSSISSMILRDQVDKGRKISEELAAKFTEKDADTDEPFTFGSPGRAHYGFAQNFILELIRHFQALMNYGVHQILFTSLEAAGEDRTSKQKILGPAAAGNALTSVIPQRVGDLIHLDIVGVPDGKATRDEYRAYYTNHTDPDVGRAWPAKLRLGPEATAFAQQSTKFQKGYIVLNDQGVERAGVAELLRWRDEMAQSGVEKLKSLMAGHKKEEQTAPAVGAK